MENLDELEANKQLYIKYIELHRDAVKYVWSKLKFRLPDLFTHKTISQVNKLVKNHDKSKYNSAEFDGYRQWYYPTDYELRVYTKKQRERYFKKAKDTHRVTNPHHIGYWSQSGLPKEIPLQYILEMLCDWTAGIWLDKEEGNVTDFYRTMANLPINQNTYGIIRALLPDLDSILDDIRSSNE